jgi:hypothetical protein
MTIKITLTEKELIVAKVFANTSIDCCGSFQEEENMSFCNANDLAEETGMSLHQIAGLIGSLDGKCVITDTGDSARGDNCNDYIGNDGIYKMIPELADLVTDNY